MGPALLIASPQMRDPFFERAVVLLWHHDEEGAVGVVVNRALGHTLPEVLAAGDEVDLSAYREAAVGWGGPVEPGTGTAITRGRIEGDEGWLLDGGLSVTRSHEALLRLIGEGADVLLCLGYAGWGPGQLDEEIARGGWLWTDLDEEIVFGPRFEDRYTLALKALGLNAGLVRMTPAEA